MTEVAVKELLFSLIRFELTGDPIPGHLLKVSKDTLLSAYKLASGHDLGHLVADAAIKNELIEKDSAERAEMEKRVFLAVYRHKRMEHDSKRMTDLFDAEGIDYILLKGSVIRNMYPAPFMRTSCDIDILIRDEDKERAKGLLCEKLGFVFDIASTHDYTFTTPNKLGIELHFTLIEDDIATRLDAPLCTVWQSAVPTGVGNAYEMPDELFYYYHIAHMVKHYINGGCGIRPFLDLWVMRRKKDFDTDPCKEMLEKGGVLTFSEYALKLSSTWLDGAAEDDVVSVMEEYILTAGTYGSAENRATAGQIKKGGKFRYILYRIWVPYDKLKYLYPSLEGKRPLTFFYEVRRWFSSVFTSKRKNAVKGVKAAVSSDRESVIRTRKMFDDLGLRFK